jgi:hypothetical protein
MLLFTSSSRNSIDRPIYPQHTRLFHSNNSTKKTFHFFDSILSRSNNKSISIKKSSIQTSSQLPDQVRCLYHYNAIKQDEICVHRGEYVHIINFDQDNRWFVRRTCPIIQGWLPGFVLGLKYPNNNNNHLSTLQIPTSSLSSNNLNHL